MIVVDASVVVKWFVAENGSSAALAIFHLSDALLAPSHAIGEIGEVLLRAYRRGAISLDDVQRANDVVATRLVLRSPAGLVDRATGIAVEAAISFYDALYVAAADLWGLDLITADAKLVERLGTTRWSSRVTLLGSD